MMKVYIAPPIVGVLPPPPPPPVDLIGYILCRKTIKVKQIKMEITLDVVIFLSVNNTWVQPEKATVFNTPEQKY